MDPAWVGVIGGAVGAAGSLAGSVATQVIAANNAKSLKTAERADLVQDRWFEEKRDVYLEVVEIVTKTQHAFVEINLATHERRQEMQEVDDLLIYWERLYALYPRLLMLGSDRMYMGVMAYTDRITKRVEYVRTNDPEGKDIDGDYSAFKYLIHTAREDLGIGDNGAAEWVKKMHAKEWGLDEEVK